MVQGVKKVGENRYRETFGRYYEEFEVGDIYEHRPGRTITPEREHLVHPADDEYAPDAFRRGVCEGQRVRQVHVRSPFTVALMVGMSVTDVSQKAIANLGWSDIKLTHPLFAGDTLYAESEVLAKREASRGLAQACVGQDDRQQPGQRGGVHLRAHDADRPARAQRRGQGRVLTGVMRAT